jgi:hypothetical protein
MNSGVTMLVNMSFDLIKPQICKSIQCRVQSVFRRDQLQALLRKIFALDALANSKSLQTNLNKIVAETINPEASFVQRQWNSVGVPLLKGILSDSKYCGSAFSMGLRIVGTLQGLYEIQVIIEKIYEALVQKLTKMNDSSIVATFGYR